MSYHKGYEEGRLDGSIDAYKQALRHVKKDSAGYQVLSALLKNREIELHTQLRRNRKEGR